MRNSSANWVCRHTFEDVGLPVDAFEEMADKATGGGDTVKRWAILSKIGNATDDGYIQELCTPSGKSRGKNIDRSINICLQSSLQGSGGMRPRRACGYLFFL